MLNKFFKANGFTIIELLVVIAIAGLITSIGLPSFGHFLEQSRINSEAFKLLSHHNYARSEAIKSNQRVTLCKSDNGNQCSKQSSWKDGWIIFSDINKNKQIDAAEKVWLVEQRESPTTISYRGFGSSNYVSYFPDGRSTTNGTFTVCHHDYPELSKALIISRTGRPRIDTRSSTGKPLLCPAG